MAESNIKYNSQIEKDEHDNSSNILAKRVILVAWNSSTLQYERVTSTSGVLNTSGSGSGGGGAVTVADGSDVTEGATTDVVIAAGAAGTISAKLRRISTDIDTIITNTNKIISAPATSALQTTGNASLASIDGKITAVNTGAVVISSSALPSGAATGTKQDTGNTSLASIDTKTPALGQALAAASVPVILPSATITTLTPPAAITGFATSAKQDTGNTSVASIDTKLTVPATIYNGKTTVTTAGTRVVLAAATTVKSVTIKALVANTGTIYVGNATVAAANGFALSPGEGISMDIADLNTINIDASVNGEGVTYLGVN